MNRREISSGEAMRQGFGILEGVRTCGPVAQLGARFHGMEEVKGSNPFRSTKSPSNPHIMQA